MLLDETDQLLAETFFPFYADRAKVIRQTGRKFVHYTSAQTALSILEHKELWMRSTSCMNDFSEVQYGESLFSTCIQTGQWQKFMSDLGTILAIIFNHTLSLAMLWFTRWQASTYITCLSEHEEEEDRLGRLSMWRGYGKDTGVAIVFKPDIFTSDFDVFSIMVL